jgi:prophage tail gpP-like protein
MPLTNSISLLVNGKEYTQFKEIKVSRSLDSIAGSFEFIAANKSISQFPLKLWDEVQVRVNGIVVIGGYISKLVPSYSESKHDINVIGFDIARDLADVTISANAQYATPISMAKLVQRVMNDNGITDVLVLDESGAEDFKEGELMAGETGDTVWSYIDKHAKKRQVLVVADGSGGINIYRNRGIDSGVTLENKVNRQQNSRILSSAATYDNSKRFSKVIVKSQGEFGESDVSGEATDSTVKRSRIKTIISDTVQDIAACNELAKWEVNKRRSDSVQYTCNVQGFWAKENLIWGPNLLVNVLDDYADINSSMLLRDVNYSFSEKSGSTTSLTFVAPDSYSLQANDPRNANKIGDNLND